jgi:phosphoadenosine phosphosulfate reductase
MNVTMVKKILLDGSPCGKCVQAEEILVKRGYMNRIDRVVYAREGLKESEGMKLAAEFGVDLAPFFIVRDGEKIPRVYTRVFEFIRMELEGETPADHPETFDADLADRKYAALDPASILDDVQTRFGASLTLAFSGAEDVVLIDMAVRNKKPFSVFCLDTGRLHEETCSFLDTVRNHYGIAIETYTPSPVLLEPFLREKGLNSFYREGHRECCGIRKVEPLGRALSGRLAWATGLRRDQSPATREKLRFAELDESHLGQFGRPVVKINPLLNWSSAEVWDYIRSNGVPYNSLHDMGFRSIGCAPCTRASRPGEHERAARWWWEEETRRECGLHTGPLQGARDTALETAP